MVLSKIPSVSVIIPSYNHEKYIRQAIESVLNSSVNDLELIIVDDGSTDRSVEIIERIKDPRITLITQKNQGAAKALNIGISQAVSPWIAILNSDDTFHPDKLETHLNIHNTDTQLEASVSRASIVSGNNNPLPRTTSMVQWYITAKKTSHKYRNLIDSLLITNHLLTTSALFANKKVLNEIGGFIPLRYTHDWYLFLRLAARDKLYLIEKPLINYRVHGLNSILEDRTLVKIEANFLIAFYFSQYLIPRDNIAYLFNLLCKNNRLDFELLLFYHFWILSNNRQVDQLFEIFQDQSHPVIQYALKTLSKNRHKKSLFQTIDLCFNYLKNLFIDADL